MKIMEQPSYDHAVTPLGNSETSNNFPVQLDRELDEIDLLWDSVPDNQITHVDTSEVNELFDSPDDFMTQLYLDDLISDNTELFRFHISDADLDSTQLSADDIGLFDNYEPTGLSANYLDDKPDISDSNHSEFFDNQTDNPDLAILLGGNTRPIKVRLQRTLGAAAMSTALLAGNIFHASQTRSK